MRRIGRAQLETGIRSLLLFLGEDPDREGLRDTPRRVIDALLEMTSGYKADVSSILQPTFHTKPPYDELIVVKGIPFVSLCEHHLMPFFGYVDVGYLPKDGVVVGLSKIPRLVKALAAKLQIQERLTEEIADAIDDILHPDGVGVIIRATHSCMKFRGAKSDGEMVTSCLRGSFRRNSETRQEFLRLTGG